MKRCVMRRTLEDWTVCVHHSNPQNVADVDALTMERNTVLVQSQGLYIIHLTAHLDRPGDMWYSESDHTYCGFQNCDKKHLRVRLPGGGVWDTDSRAANCDKPNDVIHRCWVKHTENGIENMTIDKNGDTCNAGGGSILQENWHGFIRKGMLIKA